MHNNLSIAGFDFLERRCGWLFRRIRALGLAVRDTHRVDRGHNNLIFGAVDEIAQSHRFIVIINQQPMLFNRIILMLLVNGRIDNNLKLGLNLTILGIGAMKMNIQLARFTRNINDFRFRWQLQWRDTLRCFTIRRRNMIASAHHKLIVVAIHQSIRDKRRFLRLPNLGVVRFLARLALLQVVFVVAHLNLVPHFHVGTHFRPTSRLVAFETNLHRIRIGLRTQDARLTGRHHFHIVVLQTGSRPQSMWIDGFPRALGWHLILGRGQHNIIIAMILIILLIIIILVVIIIFLVITIVAHGLSMVLLFFLAAECIASSVDIYLTQRPNRFILLLVDVDTQNLEVLVVVVGKLERIILHALNRVFSIHHFGASTLTQQHFEGLLFARHDNGDRTVGAILQAFHEFLNRTTHCFHTLEFG
mmetsp:Transcript_19684/g.31305  ORF Transcript_19684/g.31305 Transcript_19684/m.31305 type:complete len:417 (-) Transcript_19684:484-1734(-)